MSVVHLGSEHQSLDTLIKLNMPRLKAFAGKLAHGDNEDVLQDSLLRAHRFFSSFEPGTNFVGWMTKIIHNTFVNHYRKTKKEHERVFALDSGTLENIAEFEDLEAPISEEVKAAIAGLPEHYRMVFLMVDRYDYSYNDTAAILEIPVGTVMSRLHRARKLLRGALKDYALKNCAVLLDS